MSGFLKVADFQQMTFEQSFFGFGANYTEAFETARVYYQAGYYRSWARDRYKVKVRSPT